VEPEKRFTESAGSPDSQVAGGFQRCTADTADDGRAVAADERIFHFLRTVGAIKGCGILLFGSGFIRGLGHIGKEL
jgi:hypothetical protein